jgi:hypothetical protein
MDLKTVTVFDYPTYLRILSEHLTQDEMMFTTLIIPISEGGINYKHVLFGKISKLLVVEFFNE